MGSALATMRDHYENRLGAAREWRAAGGKVVGYVCDNVPEELIIAAGFLPLRVSGDPRSGSDAVERYVDALFPPTRRVAFASSMLNRLLDGTYDVLDYLIVPHNRHHVQAFYRELLDAKEAFPELVVPELHYLDKSWAPYFVSEEFDRDRVLDLKSKLEQWSGRPISDDDVASAIRVCEENRALLSRVAALRAADPPTVSGVDALHIIGSSMFMPKERHNALLREFLEHAAELPARFGVRVFVGGSPHDHTQLYGLIESCGVTVVGEDHCWGNRAFDSPIGDGDPILAIAARYHRKPACSIRFPLHDTIVSTVDRARAAGAQCAIFFVLAGDMAQAWETPDEIASLERLGVRCLHLRDQPYDVAGATELRLRVAEFVGSLGDAARLDTPAVMR